MASYRQLQDDPDSPAVSHSDGKWEVIAEYYGPEPKSNLKHRQIKDILENCQIQEEEKSLFVISIAGEESWSEKPSFINSLISYLEHKAKGSSGKWIESDVKIKETNYVIADKPGKVQMFDRPFKVEWKDGKHVWVLLIDAQNLQQKGNGWNVTIHQSIAMLGFQVSTMSIYIASESRREYWTDFFDQCIVEIKRNKNLRGVAPVINNLFVICPKKTDGKELKIIPRRPSQQEPEDDVRVIIGGLAKTGKFTEFELPLKDLSADSSRQVTQESDKEQDKMFSEMYDHMFSLLNTDDISSSLKTRCELQKEFGRVKVAVLTTEAEADKILEDQKRVDQIRKKLDKEFRHLDAQICCVPCSLYKLKKYLDGNLNGLDDSERERVEDDFNTQVKTAKYRHLIKWLKVLAVVLVLVFLAISVAKGIQSWV